MIIWPFYDHLQARLNSPNGAIEHGIAYDRTLSSPCFMNYSKSSAKRYVNYYIYRLTKT